MDRMKITVFADPVCTWCWGSVPVIRALGYRYGEQLEFDYVMGGMVEDISTFVNRRLSVGGDVDVSNRSIHEHWIDASSIHGMPVCSSGFHLFSDERRSTVPQNLAYLAAKVYARKYVNTVPENLHQRFLRRLQEATAVDAVVTNDTVNIFDLSATVGMEPEKFREIYHSDEVRKMYGECKALCAEYDIDSFPVYMLEYGGERLFVRGYTSCEDMMKHIGRISRGHVNPVDDGRELLTEENIRRLMSVCHNAYPVEIATAFSLKRMSGHTALNAESYVGLSDMIAGLLERSVLAMVPKGNGFMYYLLGDSDKVKEHRRRLAGVL